MATSSRKAAGKQPVTVPSSDNGELANVVKLAVAEAIKEAIPTLVQDVVAQLTSKTQELVEAQVAVLRSEMVTMRTDILECKDCMEKDGKRLAEVDSRLSASVKKFSAQHDRLEEKIADMEDRSRRDNIRVHGVPETAETSHLLNYMSDAFSRWFPDLGFVEIMRAHRLGAPKRDVNGKSIPRVVIMKLLRFTDRDKIIKVARSAPMEIEGKTLRFAPDYSPFTFRRRLAFSTVMDALQKLNFRTFLLYPAKLKAVRGEAIHLFNNPQEVRDFMDTLKE